MATAVDVVSVPMRYSTSCVVGQMAIQDHAPDHGVRLELGQGGSGRGSEYPCSVRARLSVVHG